MERDRYWETVSEEYADKALDIQPEFYKNSERLLNKELQGCRNAIDIGNGGVINYDFSQLEELVCADIALSQDAIQKYSSYGNVQFKQADITNLKGFEDASYDAVIVQAVLHHLAGKKFSITEENVQKALDECLRIIRPGGKLLIIESTVNRPFECLERMLYPFMQLFFKLCRFDTVYQYSNKSLVTKIRKCLSVSGGGY